MPQTDPALAAVDEVVRAATATLHPGTPARPDRFLLLLRPVDDPVARMRAIAATVAPMGATVRPFSTLDPRMLVVEFPDRAFVPRSGAAFDAAYRFADAFDLAAAEPDLPSDLFPEPVDGGFAIEDVGGFPPGCFAADEPTLPPVWAIDVAGAPAAWAFSEAGMRPDRGRGIVVAQPDTGVVAHPALVGVATAGGFDVLDDDPDPTDPLTGQSAGHGSGTASVLVSGVSGIVTGSAPAAAHMPIRAINSVVQITLGTVAEAVDLAVEHGARVITMSLGGFFSFGMQRALHRAVAADVIVLGSLTGDPRGWVFGHDATTLGGNSGSPVLTWDDTGFALNFAGITMDTNCAHGISAIATQLAALGVPIADRP